MYIITGPMLYRTLDLYFPYYRLLPFSTPDQCACLVNRCPAIVPLNNISRPFILTFVQGSTDYINAIFTDGYKHRDAFIVTQHPLPHTRADFWAMVYDHECSAIVMMQESRDVRETKSPIKVDGCGIEINCLPVS